MAKLLVQATFIYDTECRIDPTDIKSATEYLETCGYLRKIDDNFIENLSIKVIEEVQENG